MLEDRLLKAFIYKPRICDNTVVYKSGLLIGNRKKIVIYSKDKAIKTETVGFLTVIKIKVTVQESR